MSAWCVSESMCTFVGQGNGAVRLYRSGGSSLGYTHGVVQVYYGGSWGSVCMSGGTWSLAEGDVVCHQLGWAGAMSYGPAAVTR